MFKQINFSCRSCGEQYHSSSEYSGKGLKCHRCDAIVIIPSVTDEMQQQQAVKQPARETVTYSTSNISDSTPVQSNSQTTGRRTRPTRKRKPINFPSFSLSKLKAYSFPLIILLLTGCGSFFNFLFPIPLLAGTCWLGWWVSYDRQSAIAKAAGRLLQSGAIGLTFILLILLVINVAYQGDAASGVPAWLITLDDFITTWHARLTGISLVALAIITLGTMLIAALKPGWQPVTKFKLLQQNLSRVSVALTVITTFTFFSPTALDNAVNHAYYKHYSATLREKGKQERRALIAKAIAEKITTDPLSFKNYLHSAHTTNADFGNVHANFSKTATSNVHDFMDAAEYNSHDGSTGIASNNGEENGKWTAETKKPRWRTERRTFSEQYEAECKAATKIADEEVKGVKNMFAYAMRSLMPEMDGIAEEVMQEFISVFADYDWDKTYAAQVLERAMNYQRPPSSIDGYKSQMADLFDNLKSNILSSFKASTPDYNPQAYTTMSYKDILKAANFSGRYENTDPTEYKSATKIKKSCGICGMEVSPDSHVGQYCPYCHVRWGYESDKSKPWWKFW